MQTTTNSFEEIKNFIEEVPCPHCGSTTYDVVFNANYPDNLTPNNLVDVYSSSSDTTLMDQMVECKQCELNYLNPRIKEDIIMQSYSDVEDNTFISQNKERIQTFKKSLTDFVKRHNINVKDKKVLDVGCAGGAFPEAANQVGFNVVGVEPSKYLSNWAKNEYGLDIRSGILQDFNFEEKSFDIVTLWDVIEHLTRPDEVLGQIHKLLKDDGSLIVNYPDFASLPCRLMGKKWPFFLSVHLIYFTPKTIKQYLKKNGFDVVEIKPYWQTLQLGYVLKRAGQYFGIFSFFGKIVDSIGLGKLPISYYIGQTFVMAKKSSKNES